MRNMTKGTPKVLLLSYRLFYGCILIKKIVNMVHIFISSCTFMQISSNVAFVLVDEVKQLERLELETNTDVVGDPNENIEQVLNVTNTPSVSTDRTIIKI